MPRDGASRVPKALSFLKSAVTRRNGAAEALGESEERYRTLYELASDAFLNVLPDGEIIDANIAAADLLGYAADELIGLVGANDIIAPEVLEATEQAWREQLEARGQFLVDTLWVRKDGTRVPVAVSGKTLTVGDQQQFQLIGRDITERKQAEETLRASEERFRRLFESGPDAMVIAESDGIIALVNSEVEKMFGYERDELTGMPVEMLMPERFRGTHLKQRKSYFDAPYDRPMFSSVALFGQRKDGSEFPVEISLSTMNDDRGPRAVLAIRDITERKLAENALWESEERYRDLYEEAPIAFFSVGVDGRIEAANRSATELLGSALEELVGRPVLDFYADGPEGKAKAEELLRQFRAGQEIRDEELLMQRADGTQAWVWLSVRPVLDAEGMVVASRSMVVDFTERKRLEEMLRASEERFRHLYTATPAILHSIDTEGRIMNVSDRWLEVLGYDRSEVIGRKSAEFLTEESRRYAEEVALPDFWKRGAASDIHYQFVRKDGEIVDVLLSAIAEQDEEANRYRSLAVLTDITEEKRLEAQLQRAREEL
ncbi:MAG: PAS domain S-box protein, partial [Chloroflexi bacterium]|nr:PAS domain S-box protein [Chloroflexota bacterium]